MTVKPRHKVTAQAPGIDIIPDVSLEVNWATFTTGLGTVAAQGFATAFGVTDGGSNAISALVAAAGAIKPNIPVGARAWELFCLSFAWAFDELRAIGDLDPENARGAAREAMNAAKVAVQSITQVMPSSFLQRPTTLPLYQVVRDAFIRRKSSFRVDTSEEDTVLASRLDSAFTRAVFEVWSRNPDTFQPISVALSAPAQSATSFDVQWRAYRNSLIHEFEVRPVFGQERTRVSLSQLYLPLRAIWREEPNSNTRPARASERPSRKVHMMMLDDDLDTWINAGRSDDCVRLIGGGPGSGKSTTVRAFARRLAGREDLRPLFVPLQYIDIGRDLRDATNSFFVDRTRGTFKQSPLARESVEDGPPLILIFDGLDELARPGEGANEVAQLFVSKLMPMLASLSGESPTPVRAIVTGRLPSFQAARLYASAVNQASIEVIGFLPSKSLLDGDASTSEKKLAELDQRPEWWRKYASALGASTTVPRALVDTRLSGLTHEPLLCYLLALSGYVIDNWELAADNRNRIYERLVNEVWKRGWGEGGRQGITRTLTLENFNRLMETIALGAWRGGDTRVATEGRFLETLEITHSGECWEDFKRDSGEDIANLAMNFYLKSSEIERRGFEFTHKSFGDYLAARAIVAVAKTVLELGSKRIEVAAAEWFRATSSGNLTGEIADYIRDEIRLHLGEEDPKDILEMKRYFEQLASLALRDGLPAHPRIGETWRGTEVFQANAEVAIWVILNACALALGSRDRLQALVQVEWGNRNAFARLLERLAPRQDFRGPTLDRIFIRDEFSVRKCLAYIVAPHSYLFEAYLDHADLRYADLTDADLSGGHLCNADLYSADLKGARLQRAHLDGIDFSQTNISDAKFDDARIPDCKFSQLQVKDLRLSPITIADPRVTISTNNVRMSAVYLADKNSGLKYKRRLEQIMHHIDNSLPREEGVALNSLEDPDSTR